MQVLFISSLIAAGCLYFCLFLSGRIKLFRSLTCSALLQLVALGFLGNFLYRQVPVGALRAAKPQPT